MKLRNVWPFIKWMLGRMFGGANRLYQKYDSIVVKDPMFAIMPTIMMCMVSILIVPILLWPFGVAEYVGYGWFVVWTAIVLNYIRIILREQYKKFQQEREELFNKLRS